MDSYHLSVSAYWAWEISAAGNSIHLELLKEEKKALGADSEWGSLEITAELARPGLKATSPTGRWDSSPAAFDRTTESALSATACAHSSGPPTLFRPWLASESRVSMSVSDWQNLDHMPETGIEGSWEM